MLPFQLMFRTMMGGGNVCGPVLSWVDYQNCNGLRIIGLIFSLALCSSDKSKHTQSEVEKGKDY